MRVMVVALLALILSGCGISDDQVVSAQSPIDVRESTEVSPKKTVVQEQTVAAVNTKTTKESTDTKKVSPLTAVGTDKKYKELMKDANAPRNRIMIMDDIMQTNNVGLDMAGAERQDSAGMAYSETNLQVAGVDEGDIIKTDGEFIYVADRGGWRVIRTDAKGNMELMHDEGFETFEPAEIYLGEKYAVLVGTEYKADNRIFGGSSVQYTSLATAKIYDITDKVNIKERRSVGLDGDYLSSRKIGDTLYMVASSWRYDDVIPFFVDSTLRNGNKMGLDLNCMYILPERSDNCVTMIGTLDLARLNTEFDIQSFLGSVNGMYMSKNSLYLSNPNWTERGIELYKYNLSPETVEYAASGKVPGNIINQFSMDEHNGYFRVATTEDDSNSLYVLDKDLKQVGHVDGLAPGERIYSVRFMGDKGYVVTFRQTDPLFAFDLSKPTEPKLLGALKIPGYSTYLHPYKDNYLIGFGQDTLINKSGGVIATGLKMSMFDVTDMTDPKELFVEIIGDAGSTSPLLENHKAILQDTTKDIFAFPASEYIAENVEESVYGEPNRQGAFVYSIDMKEGFNLRGVISHKSEEDLLKQGMYAMDGKTDVERIIYIGDNFYTVSPTYVQAHDIKSLEQVGVLEFE